MKTRDDCGYIPERRNGKPCGTRPIWRITNPELDGLEWFSCPAHLSNLLTHAEYGIEGATLNVERCYFPGC